MDEVMMESFVGLHPQSLTWKPENDPPGRGDCELGNHD